MCNKKYSDSEMICRVCGNTFINKGVGRVKEYCSKDCKDLNSFLDAVERKIIKINFADLKHKKEMKSRIWTVSNLIIFN